MAAPHRSASATPRRGAAPTQPAPVATLPTAVLRARIAYTRAIVEQLDRMPVHGNDRRRDVMRKALLTGEGPQLLELATSTGREKGAPSFLYSLLRHYSCDVPLAKMACASIERFGFSHAVEARTGSSSLPLLITTIHQQRAKVRILKDEELLHYQVQLLELLLSQPSFTKALAMLPTDHYFGISTSSNLHILLSASPRMEWLPAATLLQQMHDTVPWTQWVPFALSLVSTGSFEFILRFLLLPQHDLAWLRSSDPALFTDALVSVEGRQRPNPTCTPLRLFHDLVSKLIAHTRECQSTDDSAVATTSHSTLRKWMKQQLADLPSTCLSIRLREDLYTGLESRNTKAAVIALIQALRDTPHLIRLDECNDNRTLIGGILRLESSEFARLKNVIPTLIERVAQMNPRVLFITAAGGIELLAKHPCGLMSCVQAEFDASERSASAAPAAPSTDGASPQVQDQPFSCLQLALIDLALIFEPANHLWNDPVLVFFNNLAWPDAWTRRPDCARLVRRIVDQLAARDVTRTFYGQTFIDRILDFSHRPREWLAAHDGSDWHEQATHSCWASKAHQGE